MKWFKQWFARMCREAWEEAQDSPRATSTIGSVKLARDDAAIDDGLNITVKNAIGGRIVQFRHYNSKTDRNTYQVYVVPDDHDFEKELTKMITLETMRAQ